MSGLAHVHASEVVGAISIASGLLMLWLGRVPGRSHGPSASLQMQSQRTRADRQVLLSLCGVVLVAIGALLARATSGVQPTGCSFQLSADQRDASLPRCFHGAARRAAP